MMSSHWCPFGGGHQRGGLGRKTSQGHREDGKQQVFFPARFPGVSREEKKAPSNLCSPAGLLAVHPSTGSGDKEPQVWQSSAVQFWGAPPEVCARWLSPALQRWDGSPSSPLPDSASSGDCLSPTRTAGWHLPATTGRQAVPIIGVGCHRVIPGL